MRPRGPRIFVGVFAVAIAGAAAWWFFLRPAGPIGAAEDPGKLLVIGDEAAASAGQTLGDLGFSVTTMTLSEAEAKAAGADLPGAPTGPQAALRWADLEGIGYVAFADPASVDFGALPVTADSASATGIQRWVVFSVGDLGMPHQATVGATERPLVEIPSWVELMRAVFEQERPASTLFAESQLPIEAVELHRQIKAAVELQGAYNAMEGKAKRLARERQQRLVESETAEPKPTILAAPLEESRALPLPRGGALVLVRPRIVEGELDPALRMEQLPSRQIWMQPPGKWALDDRVRCEALRGGVLPDTRARWIAEPRGHAIMFDVGDAWDVWTWSDDAEGCAFVRAGSVPEGADDERGSALHPDGRVVRGVVEGAARALRVHDPRGGATTIELPGCTDVSSPRWLDDARVVLTCQFDPEVLAPEIPLEDEDVHGELGELDDDESPTDPTQATPDPKPDEAAPEPPARQAWIYVVDVKSPTIAALPMASFQPDASLVRLVPVAPDGPLQLLLESHGGGRFLGRLRATMSPAELVAAPPADPAAPRPAFVPDGAALPVVALAADPLKIDLFDLEADGARDISPDGRFMVREVSPDTHVDPNGYDVAIVELKSGAAPRVIASSDRAGHVDPAFLADGAHVIFQSRYPVDIGSSLEAAAQVLALPQ